MMSRQTLTRRTMLAAAGATMSTAAFASAGLRHNSDTEHSGQPVGTKNVHLDPDAAIKAAFANWSAAYEASAHNEDRTLDETLYAHLRACEQACVKLTPVTAQGLAIQFLVFTVFGEFEGTQSLHHDFEAAMLQLAGVRPPPGLAELASVQDLLTRLAALPLEAEQ